MQTAAQICFLTVTLIDMIFIDIFSITCDKIFPTTMGRISPSNVLICLPSVDRSFITSCALSLLSTEITG